MDHLWAKDKIIQISWKSQMKLAQPIVADGVFNLYNSDTYRFNLV